MYAECTRLLERLDIARIDALEISAGQYWRTLPFKSFAEANYPEFDIYNDSLDNTFDLIIVDQISEHPFYPYRVTRNVFEMLRPGGHFLVTTPFLIRVHAIPNACTRWTETGIAYFLEEAGFPREATVTGSWGNRACVKANFRRWARRGWFGSLANEREFPLSVWALAWRPSL